MGTWARPLCTRQYTYLCGRVALTRACLSASLPPPPTAQNPDPSAAEYFASFVSKAYAALTDEVSRSNYEKYGHPDGPQVRAACGMLWPRGVCPHSGGGSWAGRRGLCQGAAACWP